MSTPDVIEVEVPSSPSVVEVEVSSPIASIETEVPGQRGPRGPNIFVSATEPVGAVVNDLWVVLPS